MSLEQVRQTIANAVKSALPSLRACETHGGRFDSVEELRRYATRGPAVLVAVLGFDNLDNENGESVADVVLAAFVVAGDQPRTPRHTVALGVVQALAMLIPNNRWGLEAAQELPKNVRGENLYAANLDKLGVALWAVSWRQKFSLGAADSSSLDAFIYCDLATQAPDGAPVDEDLVKLPQE